MLPGLAGVVAANRAASGSLTAPTIVAHNQTQGDASATTLTLSWTPTAGSNRKLLVWGAQSAGTVQSISGITANGVAMTAIAGSLANATTGSANTLGEWFYLDEANFWAGAANIVLTISGGSPRTRLMVVELSGATQGAVDASDQNATTVSGTTLSKAITTVANNALILAGAIGSANTPTLDSPVTTLDSCVGNTNAKCTDGDYVLATAGAQTIGCTWDVASARTALSLVSIKGL